MQFDRFPGLPKVNPITHSQVEVNDGRIWADQFVLESEFLSPRNSTSTMLQQIQKELLIKLSRMVFIRIGQHGRAGTSDPGMLQFAFTASGPSVYFTERLGSSQLTEEHGYQLVPAGKPPGMPFGFCLSQDLLKLDFRKQ